MTHLFSNLRGKRLLWTRYVRVFVDHGSPMFTALPRFRRLRYAQHWQMCGFAVLVWGREFSFSFGRDIHKLYGDF